MDKIPASAGWSWVKQGFALFRQQPGGLSMLFLIYMLLIQCATIPALRLVLSVLLAPAISVTFMRACMQIEQKIRLRPKLLLSGFEKPAFPRLFTLGALCLAAALMTVGLSTLIDGGMLFKILTRDIAPTEDLIRDSNVSGAALLLMVVYLPAAMAVCFAAPLIYWKKMGIGKSLFYSFFSVLHSFKAFLVFAMAWFVINMMSTQIILKLVGDNLLALVLMAPISMSMQCSLYASYKQLFGAPQELDAEPPAPL